MIRDGQRYGWMESETLPNSQERKREFISPSLGRLCKGGVKLSHKGLVLNYPQLRKFNSLFHSSPLSVLFIPHKHRIYEQKIFNGDFIGQMWQPLFTWIAIDFSKANHTLQDWDLLDGKIFLKNSVYWALYKVPVWLSQPEPGTQVQKYTAVVSHGS